MWSLLTYLTPDPGAGADRDSREGFENFKLSPFFKRVLSPSSPPLLLITYFGTPAVSRGVSGAPITRSSQLSTGDRQRRARREGNF